MTRYDRPPAGDVYLFATCVIDLFMPQAGLDAVRVLEASGITVHYPRGQSCCGQPAWSSGNPDEARAVARAQLDLFPHDWPVIVPSGLRPMTPDPHRTQNVLPIPPSGNQSRRCSSPATTRTEPGSTRPVAPAAAPVRCWQRVQWQA